MASNPFSFGQNMVGQEQWARRGESDARVSSLETSRTADEAKLAVFKAGGAALSDAATTGAAGAWVNWGSVITITNPAAAVSVVATLTGYLFDFTAIAVMFSRVGISFDGGSTYTYGGTPRTVAGQGGSNYNSQSTAATWFRSGTPTGNVLIQAQIQSNVVTSGSSNGDLVYVMVPV